MKVREITKGQTQFPRIDNKKYEENAKDNITQGNENGREIEGKDNTPQAVCQSHPRCDEDGEELPREAVLGREGRVRQRGT